MDKIKNDFEIVINRVNEVNTKNGWGELGHDEYILRQLLMMITEITETVEALRNRELDYNNITEEIIDLLVRVFDFIGFIRYRLKDIGDGMYFNQEELEILKKTFQQTDFLSALLAKVEYNETRGYRHGRRF